MADLADVREVTRDVRGFKSRYRVSFGPWMRSLRHAARRTLEEVATAARVSPQYLSEIETGRRMAPPENGLVRFAELADALGVDIAQLRARVEDARRVYLASVTRSSWLVTHRRRKYA